MPARCGTFDEYPLLQGAFERAMRRLDALASQAAWQLRSLPSASAAVRFALWKKRFGHEPQKRQDAATGLLVARCRNGDTAAMECLIERYKPRIAGFALACVGDVQVLEDLCQTIFYKMFVGLGRLEAEDKFEAWLFRIARNACFDHLRKQRLLRIFVPWHSQYEQITNPPQAVSDRRLDAFRAALKMLPRKQRELVALLQDEQLSYEELAAITQSSVSSVRARLFRARRQLRKSMRDEG